MELVLGEEYSVSVVKYVSSGVIVKMSDDSTQLIHLSRLSSKFVADPSDLVSIGDTLIAKCVEGTSRPLELSIIHLGLVPKRRIKNITDKLVSDSVQEISNDVETKQTKSLDDMIADMNAAYEDKMRSKRNRDVRKTRNKR